MEWEQLARRVGAQLSRMKRRQYLILIVRPFEFDGPPVDPNHYVQFAREGKGGLLAEAVSNCFLTGGAMLDAGQELRLHELGWKSPETHPSRRDRENYYRIWDPPVPFEEVADLAVMTFGEIYWAEEPSDLRYKAFDRAGNRFVLNDLGLALDR
jgi:hypothetical protein